jgi:small conductance mechanosensitive channel
MEQELAQFTAIYAQIVAYLVEYSLQIVGAVIVFLIGLFISRRVGALMLALCKRKNLDITLSRFFSSSARLTVVVATLIIVLPKIGIQITPFIAAIGAVGLGAGLAVQGLLSNYSAGLSIIFTRLFVVGDTIRVRGVWGIVEEVHLSHAVLTNEDGEIITIPNKHIVGEIIHNSQADTVLELTVGVAYDSDVDIAISAVRSALSRIEGLSTNRVSQIGIAKFGDSAIEIEARVWVQTRKFHEARFEANYVISGALDKAGIGIPFPQRVVRVLEPTLKEKA